MSSGELLVFGGGVCARDFKFVGNMVYGHELEDSDELT